MKKLICFSMILLFVASIAAQPVTVYLNSKTITCDYYGKKKECLQYKNNQNDTAWKVYQGNIKGFTYNPGFFYTLQVQRLQNPMQWRLAKVVSKTKSTMQQQPGDSTVTITKPPAALVGQWNYSRFVSGDGEAKFEKEFLRFDATDLKVTGKASCNNFFGNYTIDTAKGEKAIHFEALGHTMMACPNLATENKMLRAMELIDNWTITADKLYLKAGNKTLIELTKAVNNEQ